MIQAKTEELLTIALRCGVAEEIMRLLLLNAKGYQFYDVVRRVDLEIVGFNTGGYMLLVKDTDDFPSQTYLITPSCVRAKSALELLAEQADE